MWTVNVDLGISDPMVGGVVGALLAHFVSVGRPLQNVLYITPLSWEVILLPIVFVKWDGILHIQGYVSNVNVFSGVMTGLRTYVQRG